MALTHFKIQLSVEPKGGGEAQLVPPPVLQGLSYRFVLVKDGGEEGIVQLDEPKSVLEKIQRNRNCTKLTKKQLETVRSGYPAPKLKQRYRARPLVQEAGPHADATAEPYELDDQGKRIVDDLQTVRVGLYLIDVPVVRPATASNATEKSSPRGGRRRGSRNPG
jgi:hypothetical protein